MLNNNNNITTQSDWQDYWANYRFDRIPDKVVFEKYMPSLKQGKSFIEIGGFPGIHAAYFYKHGITDVTILDFYMDSEIVRKLEKMNHLPENAIQCITADFFSFSSDKKYDIVFSSGFVEHFQNTFDVICRHVDLLSENGQLLILIPNFRGLNGLIQRWFDKDNLKAHNLRSMEIHFLQEIMQTFGLRDVRIEYIGKPMLWLEPKPENKGKQKLVKMLSYVAKLFPFKGQFLSPFIAIYAKK
jgi:2-polyprenyl-3-methyl-5-hydroxy-6-metoxy-1,4-benzoquinol methylase